MGEPGMRFEEMTEASRLETEPKAGNGDRKKWYGITEVANRGALEAGDSHVISLDEYLLRLEAAKVSFSVNEISFSFSIFAGKI